MLSWRDKIKNYWSIQYALTFLFFVAVYGTMFIRHYSTDTYVAIANKASYGTGNIIYGRFGCEIVYRIAIALEIDYDKAFPFLIFGVIFSLSFFTNIVAKKLVDARVNITKIEVFLFWLGVATMTCNPFVAEWLQFWECSFQWMFSLIFSALAISIIKGNLNYKKFILITCLEFCSLSFYQASLALFLISGLLIVYVSNDGKLTSRSFWSSVWVLTSGACASILNLSGIKLCQALGLTDVTSRTGSITVATIFSNCLSIIKAISELLIYSYDLYPKYLLLIILVLMFGIIVVNLKWQRNNVVNKLLYILLLWCVCLFSVFIPHLITGGSNSPMLAS